MGRPLAGRRGRASVFAGGSLWLLLLGSCGGRTLPAGLGGLELPENACFSDGECAGPDRCTVSVCRDFQCKAVAVVDCDDADPCTADVCDPESGGCLHGPASLDLDGDGFRALRVETPGSAEAALCGNDCDDTNANAHPGGVEVCDGVDNDCNGIVDDNVSVTPTGQAHRISVDTAMASVESIGFSVEDGAYLGSYSAQVEGRDEYRIVRLDGAGRVQGAPIAVTKVGANNYAGPLVFVGDRFGTAWSDRRDAASFDGNYEIYFNELRPDGQKIAPDLRVSRSVGFSVSPSLTWTGAAFVAVWQDDGFSSDDTNQIVGQRIALGGALEGASVLLSGQDAGSNESPVVAQAGETLGMAWVHGRSGSKTIQFAVFDKQLNRVAGPVELLGPGLQGVSPAIVHSSVGYTVAWHDPTGEEPVSAAVLDESASILSLGAVTQAPRHSRYPHLLSYGDRVLLLWSDDRDGNAGYELYAKTLTSALRPMTPEFRVTRAPGDSIGAVATFGAHGDVAVLFRDDREGSPQVYFTRLTCAQP